MKGQAQVVSAVIVILLISASVATLLPWSSKIIQKKKDIKSLEDTYNFFILFDETIRDVAKNGGEQTLTLDVPGIFEVYPDSINDPYNNSIIFSFQSRASNIATGGWIPLNTPNTDSPAVLSIDTPSVIFGRAESGDEKINIGYRLWYRELFDKQTDNGFKIVLNTTDNTKKSTTSGFIKIQRLKSKTEDLGPKDLTITEINIII